MKKDILFILVTVIISTHFVFAQTYEERQNIIANYDLDKLDQFATQYHEEFNTEKQRALALAAIFNWELYKDLPNGGRAMLVGVLKNGDPKYYATDNIEGVITTRTDKVHTNGGAGLDLNGENMIIGIWDGGRVRETHELLINPIDQIDEVTTISNHATHVAGTLVGTGAVQGGIAKGMAPEAELWAHDFNDPASELITAAANGLLISNHSWGIQESSPWVYGFYDEDARFVDELIYNAPYHLFVKSAGNLRNSGTNSDDGGYDYLTSFSNAKNHLVVAAVNEVLSYTGPSCVHMSSFSSWGPSDDGRIKPDISAKGVAMYSSVGNTDDFYTSYSGTSMSAPNVSGSLILLQQHYNLIEGNFMLASTLRGLALHTADEAGTHPGPDYRFGWGLLNIEKAAEVISYNNTTSIIKEEELHNGEVYTVSVKSNGIDDLKVSITWTDVPGDPLSGGPEFEDNSTPMLVNDLDLRVSQDGGATFFPWKLDAANPASAATKGNNLVDTIEKIEIANPTGEYIIQVSHKGNFLTNESQVFSLIVTGIDKEQFTVSSHQGIKISCAEAVSTSFEIDLEFNDGYSDNIVFSVSNLPSESNVNFSPDSLGTEGITVLTVENTGNLSPGDHMINVVAASTKEIVQLKVIIRILGPDLPEIGLVFPPDEAVDVPYSFIFEWEQGDSTVANYDFELSRFENFSTLEFSKNVPLPSVPIESITEGAEYFWRVRPNTVCYTGEYSYVSSFIVEEALSNNALDMEGLVAYPNPATNILNIETVPLITSVEVMNTLGQSLFFELITANFIQIHLSTFSPGTYFISVTVDNSTKVIQVIKQ